MAHATLTAVWLKIRMMHPRDRQKVHSCRHSVALAGKRERRTELVKQYRAVDALHADARFGVV